MCDHCPSSGASWGGDSNIIAAAALGELFSLPEAGGIPRPLTKPSDKGEVTHRYPQILPGGETVLFTANTRRGGYDGASIDLLSLKTGQWKTVHHGGYFGRYLPSGHLVYIHQGTLFGAAFDPVRGELQGTPAPLLEDVAGNPGTAGGQFDFSQTGTLVYLNGKSPASSRRIAWLDRAGKTYPLLAPGDYANFRLSPDGKLLALAVREAGASDISIYDPERDAMTKITFAGHNTNPVWTPDGTHIVCVSESSAGQILSWIRADGAGEPQRLLESKGIVSPYSFSPDGRRLAYIETTTEVTNFEIWTLPLDTSDPDHPIPGKPELFLHTPFSNSHPAFSPDGRWLAYLSNESGTNEVYVRPFPGPGGKWQISSGGGSFPVWSRDARELLYETPDGHIMTAGYTVKGDSFARDKVRQWSSQPIYVAGVNVNFDLAPDGKRVVMFPLPQESEGTKTSVHVTFLLNFFDELRRKMPPK